MIKKKSKPAAGQVYAAEFPNKYWFALVVLNVVENSYLVYTTPYYQDVPPTIDKPDLLQYYYSYDPYREKREPSIYWVDGKPGDNYKLIGEIDLTNKKEKNESDFYGGIWKHFLPIELMRDKEKETGTVYEEELPVSQIGEFEEIDEKTFWSFIDLIDVDHEEPMEALINHLKEKPVETIYAFEEALSHKLYLLDRPEHAGVNGESVQYLSPDAFLYARCAVIVQGKSFFDQIVQKSAAIDLDSDAEELLEAASEAYSRKTGESFDYVSGYDYETYSNVNAWEKR